ncbi:MAG: flagellar hook-associated protein FlgK [Desulfurivibrio sp.]|nr:flagellar hook-associated protein FlgK [Desulfurivibrio sp.]
MSGITHVLNLAKQALLTHQASMQVTSHNVANVDTPGYTRQKLNIEANNAFPTAAGLMGGGVKADQISRQYDQFMTERLASQSSLLGNLDAQQQALRVVEPIFNEARGLAMNDLMNQFWNSWQELSDNPEALGARQNVLQQGQLLADHLGTMNSEIIRARSDIGTNLKSAVNDINSLTGQIAQLNNKIATAEVGNAEANDLRDKRDNQIKELAELVNINQFSDKNGASTVMLADGHPLVEGNEAWQVDWVDDQLNWVGTSSTGQTTSRALNSEQLGGKIGGWLEIHDELAAGDPNNYAGRLDSLAKALIRELNQLHSTGAGTVRFDSELVGGERGAMTSVATGQVDDATAGKTIGAGSIQLNGLDIGEIKGSAPVHGRAMGKAANAVEAFNQADAGVSARLTTQVAGTAVDTTDLAETDRTHS